MRRIRIAAVSVMVAAGLIAAVAAPASAAKPVNYGDCVKNGIVNPAESDSGPLNTQADPDALDGLSGGVLVGVLRSDHKPRFTAGIGCGTAD